MKDNIVSKTGIHNVVHWMKTWLLLAGYWIVDCAALFWSTFIIGTLSSEQFGMVGVFCACGLVMFGGIFAPEVLFFAEKYRECEISRWFCTSFTMER